LTAAVATATAVATAVTIVPAGVPVEPSREQARGWAAEELAKREYQAERPGLFRQALEWVVERLQDLPLPGSPEPALALGALLVVVAVLVVVLLRYRTGLSRARAASAQEGAVFADRPRSAREHRAAADAASAAGDLHTSVLERFRAVVRSLEERAILPEQPGRTADEAAALAGRTLPAVAEQLAAGARLFDDVRYGDRPATRAADDRLRALDDAVQQAKPAGLQTADPQATGLQPAGSQATGRP